MARRQRTNIISIRSVDEWKARLDASTKTDKLMVVEFKISKCDYCAVMEPTVQEFAGKYNSEATFIQINMDSQSKSLLDVARQYGVTGYPTFILIMKGKQVDKVVGTRKDDLEKKIEKHAIASSKGIGGIITLQSSDEWKARLDASTKTDKLMVVEFKISKCDYCAVMEPTVQEFAGKYNSEATFIQINMDSESSLLDVARQYGVTGYPTFILIMKGKQVDKVVGTRKDDLEKKIEKHAIVSSKETGEIITLQSLDEWKGHLKTSSNKLIVAGFLASWCPYCELIKPSVEEFAKTYTDVKFFKFDMTSPPDEIADYGKQIPLRGYPTFILMKREKQVDTVVGPRRDELKHKIEKYSRP